VTRVLGIDIGPTSIRAVLLASTYRRISLEQVEQVRVDPDSNLDDALSRCAGELVKQADSLAVSIDGSRAFVHRIGLPAAAAKRVDEVVPYELEAQVPVDIDELVYDYRLLRRASSDTAASPLVVLTAAARLTEVRGVIGLVQRVLGREPDRIGIGALPLANLALPQSKLAGPGPIGLINLSAKHTEIVVLSFGAPVFARTLTRGVESLPAEAHELVATLKQSVAAWHAQGGEQLIAAYLVGSGAHAAGAEPYLSHHLGMPVERLTEFGLQGTLNLEGELPRFAKAIALALGLTQGRDLDLRKGPLAYQRGYGFLKEKAPVLMGLLGAILVSFAFAMWSELRAITSERGELETRLGAMTKAAFGEETTDPDQANELLTRAQRKEEADPKPELDAFDVIVELSKAVPSEVSHDVEEFDMSRGHVKINGIVPTTPDAENILNNFKQHHCFKNAKIAKVTQVINGDKQKYVLELDVNCAPAVEPKKPKTEEAAP
jgi:general secretion pathway protein L